MPINIATAKESLKKINGLLKSPHLLIGGLAVEQYYKGRDSQDIDLVCSHEIAKLLLTLFPTNEWVIEEHNDDEYRPSFEITHQIEQGIVIKFGPKIIERKPYDYLDWDAFKDGATPFKYKGEEYAFILIPAPESLAFTKLVSSVQRKEKSLEKSIQDFQDFVNLSNHKLFNLNRFVYLLKKANFDRNFTKKLSKSFTDFSDQWEVCNLKFLIDTILLGKSNQINLKDRVLDIIEGDSSFRIDGNFPLSEIYPNTNEESQEDLITRLKGATSEFITFGLTRNFYADGLSNLLLEKSKSIRIKIFLMNPDCESRKDRYRIEPLEASFEQPERFKRRIVEKFQRLIQESKKAAGNGSINIFFYDFPCSFAIEKIDNCIRVMLYGHGVRGTDGPIFTFREGTEYFDYFNKQLIWLQKMGEENLYDEARASNITVEKLL